MCVNAPSMFPRDTSTRESEGDKAIYTAILHPGIIPYQEKSFAMKIWKVYLMA